MILSQCEGTECDRSDNTHQGWKRQHIYDSIIIFIIKHDRVRLCGTEQKKDKSFIYLDSSHNK